MRTQPIASAIEDHALERVPDAARKDWLKITWNTAGLVTTLVMLFFGALVCFVAGVKIALYSGVVAFIIGNLIGWAIARVAFVTGHSNTLITRQYGLGTQGSALASIIFGVLIIGFLALENALLYRGFLFFFEIDDSLLYRFLIYGGLTLGWILLTAFGFNLVTRFSSIMVIAFVLVIIWVMVDIIAASGRSFSDAVLFPSQFPPAALTKMGLHTDLDKFIFGVNILVGPACALALNTADFGRYGKSTAHIGAAVTIGIFFQSLVTMIIGGVLMYAGANAMVDFYVAQEGITISDAHQRVLQNPDSIAATFMVFAGIIGFILMIVAQGKAQVLNSYSSSLCLANLFDALFNWKPGRLFFVILANIIALAMLYGHILELVESWIKLMGVLLSSLAGVIIMDYYWVKPYLSGHAKTLPVTERVNWSGVITIIFAVLTAHYWLKPYLPIEVITSLVCVAIFYPLLRLVILRPKVQAS